MGVDVWRCTLAHRRGDLTTLARTLDPGERARAARFVFTRDRARFVAGRGLLRLILARYLGRPPETLAFAYGDDGKPALDEASARGCPPPSFNVSHADDLLVIAVAAGVRRVGVDVERVREAGEDGLDTAEIAARFFSRDEQRALAELEPTLRQRAFFACWTRKEAFIKALGGGLAIPLDAFDVSVDPDAPPRVLAHRLPEAAGSSWSLHALPAAPRYAATLAVTPALQAAAGDAVLLWHDPVGEG